MNTLILDAKQEQSYKVCSDIIRSGGLVAFPTETVYGLGANGFCENAVKKIFEAKGRPSDNPLILHVESIAQAEKLYRDIPQSFYKLAEVFWPAPLTIICKKASCVPDAVSGGLDTVAVRMPSDKHALRLIHESGVPIAAPSANLSGKPSPTRAEHVIQDMQGRIDAILCAGDCKYGVESTVISLVNLPTILRPGIITPHMISAVIGEVQISKSVFSPLHEGELAPSPGMKYKHYSPDAEVMAFSGNADEMRAKICSAYDMNCVNKMKCIILASAETAHLYGDRQLEIMGSAKAPESMCSSLFAAFRKYNEYDYILCETLADEELGLAYMNRLLRACGFLVL
ncbi:MAG: threonylcarbamoyl-AMP synthase [Clostridia bacterium]|nr:threonylcarbamoyl-AMP synthase [Clostridia bacterium]